LLQHGVTANRSESKYDKCFVGDILEIDATHWMVADFGVQLVWFA